jgi:hypothetical protein
VPEEDSQLRGEQVEPHEHVEEVELEERCAGEDVAARLAGGQRFVQPPSAVSARRGSRSRAPLTMTKTGTHYRPAESATFAIH